MSSKRRNPRIEHPAAAETLLRDGERMVTFYEFLREHWKHLRATKVVKPPFAAVRLRTDAGKRHKKVVNANSLVWRLLMVAERTFRRLDPPELLPEVAMRAQYRDGIRVVEEQTTDKGGRRLISFTHFLT